MGVFWALCGESGTEEVGLFMLLRGQATNIPSHQLVSGMTNSTRDLPTDPPQGAEPAKPIPEISFFLA
jgi:hypothetical protein